MDGLSESDGEMGKSINLTVKHVEKKDINSVLELANMKMKTVSDALYNSDYCDFEELV